ncbi:penicillin acylase family protein [Agaribacter marinus]|uniref:Peptidase n=1 Tax=Agaribacter marinus TaxID=1431249 RepID=A0AA37SYF6_9ALTE|nr:penicillin acylase family protein [Agaribacter marinus]GLR70181.1 peptidase [Agaribacter marinus]
MKTIKILSWSLIILLSLAALASLGAYLSLKSSLPILDGKILNANVSANTTLQRDRLGTAIINAPNKLDSAYALGFAHAQDRLFQMDLLRKNAAGELSSIVGRRALNVDKAHRVHQFRQRARSIFEKLPEQQRALLQHYANGVNDAVKQQDVSGFEYILTGTNFTQWLPEDSLLATFSMYIDLQQGQIERDFHFTGIQHFTSENLLSFFTQASNYQSTMDFSVETNAPAEIPPPPRINNELVTAYKDLIEVPDIGSNNWAVAGDLVAKDLTNNTSTTSNTSAMLSNDMHLGLRVPALWYRAQLNYMHNDSNVSVTGVSLPGTPAVIVGSNGHIAWGFTNSNVDNVDWIALSDNTAVRQQTESVTLPNGEIEKFTIAISDFGPVRNIDGINYALKWVAHEDYAINMLVADLAEKTNIHDALSLAKHIAIPVQNMAIADSIGEVAWQLTGAITSRTTPSKVAVIEENFDPAWKFAEQAPANIVNPEHGRIWSANARVVSTKDLPRYGDGGYALGARQQQIADKLMGGNNFTEDAFYQLQLDNQAQFLMPWHHLLLSTLKQNPQRYEKDIALLDSWQACACADSIGYTLVRRFRSRFINEILKPINGAIKAQDHANVVKTRYLLRSIEPAIWQLINNQANDWLDAKYPNYDEMIKNVYVQMKHTLMAQFDATEEDLSALAWGNVNALTVKHPLASSLGFIGEYLNMPTVPSFGDSYMPAVQSPAFGASQRLIVQPGHLKNAILTIPGGQSMHPLSPFYFSGFDEYATHQKTPLLPQSVEHTLQFNKK